MSVSSMIDRNGVSVQISIRSDATDTVGGQVQSYANQASTTALVQVKTNSDGSVAGAVRSAKIATIYFKGRPTVDVDDRIVYDSKTWNVTSVRVPDERPASDALCYTIVEAAEVFG